MSSLHETKSFDAIIQKDVRHTDKNPQQAHSPHKEDVNTVDNSTNQDDAWHMERGVTNVASSTILKMYAGVLGNSAVNTIEKEAKHEQEPGIKMVNINSVNFNSNHSTMIANLKTSSNKANIMVPYKVDKGSDGNIMAFNIFT